MSSQEQEKRRHKKPKKLLIPMALLFLVFIFGVVIINLADPDKDFSSSENRELESMPKVTVASLENGRFMSSFENYSSDQFFGRNRWLQLQVVAQRIAGKKESHGVFLGKDSYLLEDIAKPDEENVRKNLKAILKFQTKYKDAKHYMLLVPNAANVLSDDLPAFAVMPDQDAQIASVKKTLGSSVTWLDASTPLKKNTDTKLYYRTDHHWTTQGANVVFQSVASKMGITELVNMKSQTVTKSFNGTLASTSGYRTGYQEPIDIYAQTDTNPVEVVVNDTEKQEKTASMYDSSKLKGKDKYGVFFGGNHPELDIRTTSKSNRRLLVLKDSYANCFLPFLAPYYREIIVIDPRYFYTDITSVMEDNTINDVLYLYNGNTFFKDSSLAGVLNDK